MKRSILILAITVLLIGCGGKGKDKQADVFDKIEKDLEKIEKSEEVMKDVNDKIKKMQQTIENIDN